MGADMVVLEVTGKGISGNLAVEVSRKNIEGVCMCG